MGNPGWSLTHVLFQETCREIKDGKCIITMKCTQPPLLAVATNLPSTEKLFNLPLWTVKGKPHPKLTKPKWRQNYQQGTTADEEGMRQLFGKLPSLLHVPMVVETAYINFVFFFFFLLWTAHLAGLQVQRVHTRFGAEHKIKKENKQ